MNVRNAAYRDAPDIKILLEVLGYKTTTSILVSQLEAMFGKDDYQVFVYELRKEIVGFVSVHFMTQLAFDGGLVFISYLSVKEEVKDQGVATALEQFVVEWAKKGNVTEYKYTVRIGALQPINFILSRVTRNIRNILQRDWFMANN